MNAARFDPRAWIAWAGAMSLPAMLGRNPYPIAAVLVVAIAVRSATMTRENDWGRLLKLAAVFAGIGVVFNVITYHGGDRVIATIPEWIPVFGGPVTLNALVFGLLSGLALITLVMIWSTIAAQIDWSDVIRLTPPGLGGLAVSSSIAITLVPKTIESFSEIREVQAIRGFPMKGPRDLVPLVAPLLTVGLERSITLSEALESRGFGGPDEATNERSRGLALVAVALTAGVVAAFLVVTGRGLIGIGTLLIAIVATIVAARLSSRSTSWRPTRYRPVRLSRADMMVIAASIVSAVSMLVVNRVDRSALFYEPYPTIAWPTVNIPVMIAIALLLAPLVVSPGADHRRNEA